MILNSAFNKIYLRVIKKNTAAFLFEKGYFIKSALTFWGVIIIVSWIHSNCYRVNVQRVFYLKF